MVDVSGPRIYAMQLFIIQKLAKSGKGASVPRITPKVWSANRKNRIHPFLDLFHKLEYWGVLVGFGWLWM